MRERFSFSYHQLFITLRSLKAYLDSQFERVKLPAVQPPFCTAPTQAMNIKR